MRIVTTLLVLVLLGAVGLAGYAYLGDLRPEQREIIIDLPAGAPGAPAAAPAPAGGTGGG